MSMTDAAAHPPVAPNAGRSSELPRSAIGKLASAASAGGQRTTLVVVGVAVVVARPRRVVRAGPRTRLAPLYTDLVDRGRRRHHQEAPGAGRRVPAHRRRRAPSRSPEDQVYQTRADLAELELPGVGQGRLRHPRQPGHHRPRSSASRSASSGRWRARSAKTIEAMDGDPGRHRPPRAPARTRCSPSTTQKPSASVMVKTIGLARRRAGAGHRRTSSPRGIQGLAAERVSVADARATSSPRPGRRDRRRWQRRRPAGDARLLRVARRGGDRVDARRRRSGPARPR